MVDLDKIKILVICGPTASGKTSLAVKMAKKLNGEIISADSMQIYKDLSVGTAKVTHDEMQGVPHYLIDILEPSQIFSVADYVDKAKELIFDINSRGLVPIIVGGTGLYISSLIDGISFTNDDTDYALRDKLRARLDEEGIDKIYDELVSVDPQYAKTVHKNNTKRVLRALELYYQTGSTMTNQLANSKPKDKPFNDVVIELAFEDRQTLYDRINYRVDKMIELDVVSEARYVFDNKDTFTTASQAIGYKEFFEFFTGDQSLVECSEKLKQGSRKYAKRQLTWFNRISNAHKVYVDKSEDIVKKVMDIWEK